MSVLPTTPYLTLPHLQSTYRHKRLTATDTCYLQYAITHRSSTYETTIRLETPEPVRLPRRRRKSQKNQNSSIFRVFLLPPSLTLSLLFPPFLLPLPFQLYVVETISLSIHRFYFSENQPAELLTTSDHSPRIDFMGLNCGGAFST